MNTLQIGLIASAGQTSGSDRYYFDLLRALRAHDVGARGVVLGNPHDLNPAPEGVVGFAPEGSGVLTRWRGLRRAVAPLLRESDLAVSHFAPHAFAVLDRIRKLPLVALAVLPSLFHQQGLDVFLNVRKTTFERENVLECA